MTSISLVGRNATAGALSARPEIAGTGSALAGALQFATGSLAGAAVGLLHDGTAVPMATTIGGAGVLGFVLHRALVLRRKPRVL